jgi:ABC-type dipeptide/oligopeptide/nickel transport system permease component
VRAVAAYAGRRLLIAVPLLWVVSVFSYLLLYRAADPVARLRRIPGVRAEDLGRLIEQQGLDAPWYEGYWTWLRNFLSGDWGVSTASPGSSALGLIGDALPATIELMLLALVVSTVVGITIGVVSATRPMSRTDLALSGVAYLGFATPTFLVGVLLQLGAVWLRDNGWAAIPFALGTVLVLVALARLRRGGAGTIVVLVAGAVVIVLSLLLWGRLGGDGQTLLYTGQRYSFGHEGEWFSLNHLQHLVLPVITLALVNIAVFSRFQRAVLIQELGSDYVAAARARGLSERRIVLRHALRNALAPIVTLVALDLGALFAGAVVTETVFAWPGMGRLLRDAALARDINVAMGIVMIGAVAVVVANLLADLAYAALDPRVDLGGRPR